MAFDKTQARSTCPLCKDSFTNKELLKRHIFNIHSAIHRFKCKLCGQQFKQMWELQGHLTNQHNTKSEYCCNICGKSFHFKSRLNKHSLIHTNRVKERCPECNGTFIDLKSHRARHKATRNHVCDICNKTYLYRGDLNTHKLTHTEEKDRKTCPVCNAKCYDLKRHIKRHNAVKSFLCNSCGKSFLTKFELNTHQLMHTGENKATCPICYGKYSALAEHMQGHQSNRKLFSCPVCSKELKTKKGLKIHKLQHQEIREKLQCLKCEKEFISKKGLKLHLEAQHIKDVQTTVSTGFASNEPRDKYSGRRTYSCGKCNKLFLSRKNHKIHTEKLHDGVQQRCPHCEMILDDRILLKIHIKNLHSHEKRYSCIECCRKYHSLEGRNHHMLGHKGQLKKPCPKCKREIVYSNMKGHLETHKDLKERERVKCKTCNKLFVHRFSLKKHMLSHKGVHKKECPVCNDKVVALSQHMAIVHSDQTIACSICSKQFKSKSYLLKHMKRQHGDTKESYTCNVCKKSFSTKHLLTTHMKIHTGDNVKTCPVCQDKVTCLRLHFKNVHGDGQHSITCPVCGLLLRQVSLARHLKTHKAAEKHSCAICKKELKSESLHEHMKIHGDRKQDFVCNICEKSFFSRKSLERHNSRIHTGRNMKVCPVCNDEYSNLTNHLTTHSEGQRGPQHIEVHLIE